MATITLNLDQILLNAKQRYPGQLGKLHAHNIHDLLFSFLPKYSKLTGYSPDKILLLLERYRKTNVINFYNIDRLFIPHKLHTFSSFSDFLFYFPSCLYICPICNTKSSNPFTCENSNCDSHLPFIHIDNNLYFYRVVISNMHLNPLPEKLLIPSEIGSRYKSDYVFSFTSILPDDF